MLPLDRKSQWQFRVEIPDQKKEEKEKEKEKGATDIDNFSSMISNSNVGQQNTGIYTQPEYQYLNNLFVGITQFEQKDVSSNYSQGAQGCQAMDIIRGRILGSMYSQGPQTAVNFFNQKKKEGLNLICTYDPVLRYRWEVLSALGSSTSRTRPTSCS